MRGTLSNASIAPAVPRPPQQIRSPLNYELLLFNTEGYSLSRICNLLPEAHDKSTEYFGNKDLDMHAAPHSKPHASSADVKQVDD